MNPHVPQNLTHDSEPESNAKPVIQSEDSSAATVKPPSPRNPNPPDINTIEAVTEYEKDLHEKTEQLSAEPVAKEVGSNMVLRRTGRYPMRQLRTHDEIAEDAVALLLKHSVRPQDFSRSEESGLSRKKNKTDYDPSWVPPQGQSGDGRTSLNDRFGY